MSLSKSEFLAGHQCPRLLWWRMHEPTAPELQPGIVLEDLFDQGRQVGTLARARHPSGVLIPPGDREARLAATDAAIAGGATEIFEGAFAADGLFVATDVLRRTPDGWHLVEVKSASERKDEHVVDVAVQAHVLAAHGLAPIRVDLLHLNKEFRHPDTGDLFASTDVSSEVARSPIDVAGTTARLRVAIEGPLPAVPVGEQCFTPRDCPFMARCWPDDPGHISQLFNVGPKRTVQYMRAGVHRIDDLPPDAKLHDVAQRQRRAMQEGRMLVAPGLAAALAPFRVSPIGFLDFETIARAIPVWPGMAPWGQAAAQFSYHERGADGVLRHEAFLAEGPDDARPAIARRLIEATQSAKAVVMYSSFERTQIRALARAVPELAAELTALDAKLIDLLPVVKNHVAHPDFRGSFSIKSVLPVLVPDLTYKDLVIVNGLVASVQIARLLFVADRIPVQERPRVRQDLLDYCHLDTLATVRLLEVLTALS